MEIGKEAGEGMKVKTHVKAGVTMIRE